MELQIKQEGDIYIVSIIRNLGITNMSDFKNEIKRLIQEGAKKLVISFEHTKYIDSSGITALIAMKNYMKENSAEFRLTNIRGSVKYIFTLVRLEAFFRITGTLEEAIEELNA
ncbi:MAG: STAS domain-containing protein [Spirochaetales bacterium]|nr:STAS domain-containing protein [Spirochaetales bacterium]